MAWQELLAAVKASESIICEKGAYEGSTLGDLFESWPEEVISGRVQAACKDRDQASRTIRAFTKFVQAAAELKAAAGALPSSAPAIVMNSGKFPFKKHFSGADRFIAETSSSSGEAARGPPSSGKFPIVAVAATAAEGVPAGGKGRAVHVKTTRAAATQTGPDVDERKWSPAWAWQRMQQYTCRPASVIFGSMCALLLPKLFFALIRLCIECILGHILSKFYNTVLAAGGEANIFATSMVAQFETWMLYGAAAPRPSLAAAAAEAPIQALRSWAAAKNATEEEICQIVDSLQPAFQPVIAGPSVWQQPPEPSTLPGALSLGIFAVMPTPWTKW